MKPSNKKPNIIAITIGDKDFVNTCRAFLEIVNNYILDNVNHITEDYIIELWKKSSFGIYYLCQNKLKYLTHNDENLKNYLSNNIRVYFDDKAEERYLDPNIDSTYYLFINWRELTKSVIH